MSDQNACKPSAVPKIVLVIGNAGIKSLAALPIVQFLQDEHIPVDLIIGSGGGASLAALIGYGDYTFGDIPSMMATLYNRKTIMKFNYMTLLDLGGIPLQKFTPGVGLLKNKALLEAYKKVFGDRKLEETKTEVQMQVTDLFTGNGVLLNKGLVADAAYSSSALYPFIPPVKISESWYVDGMYTSTLPLLEATVNEPKIVFAIDFSRSHQALPFGLIEYYANSLNRTYGTVHTSQVSMAMMMHDIDISLIKISFPSSINLWDSNRIEEILDAGHKALDVHREGILSSYKMISDSSQQI
jgi:NTE family protein